MEQWFKHILEDIGEDIHREGLLDTPKRASQSFSFLTKGYQENIDDIINDALFETTMDEFVILKDIEMYSLCEHHLLPFFGKVHVGYIPNGKVIGLSKIARIVDFHSRRLQIQEQLTDQIANTLQHITQAKGVGVVIEAKHLCMVMRGVEKQQAMMTTSVLKGEIKKNPSSRLEFLHLIK